MIAQGHIILNAAELELEPKIPSSNFQHFPPELEIIVHVYVCDFIFFLSIS